MTTPALVVTWTLVKSRALTSRISAWTTSLTGHFYANTIMMMFFSALLPAKDVTEKATAINDAIPKMIIFFIAELLFSFLYSQIQR